MLTIGSVEKFKDYSQFKDRDDFNRNIEMFLAVHKKEFTRTEYMLFRRLTKFGAEVPGIATASIKKILAGSKLIDFAFGASESSFQRMKRKAIKLGILEVKQTERKNTSTSTNLWIFKRFVANSTTIDTPRTDNEQAKPAPTKGRIVKQLTPLKASIISKANNQYINKRIGTAATTNQHEDSSLDHTYTRDYVRKEFVQAVKPFFDDAAIIEDFWKAVLNTRYDYRNLIDSETVLNTAIHSFKQTIRRTKQIKIEKPVGYFTGVLKRQLLQNLEEIAEADSSADRKDYYTNIPNWLERGHGA